MRFSLVNPTYKWKPIWNCKWKPIWCCKLQTMSSQVEVYSSTFSSSVGNRVAGKKCTHHCKLLTGRTSEQKREKTVHSFPQIVNEINGNWESRQKCPKIEVFCFFWSFWPLVYLRLRINTRAYLMLLKLNCWKRQHCDPLTPQILDEHICEC